MDREWEAAGEQSAPSLCSEASLQRAPFKGHSASGTSLKSRNVLSPEKSKAHGTTKAGWKGVVQTGSYINETGPQSEFQASAQGKTSMKPSKVHFVSAVATHHLQQFSILSLPRRVVICSKLKVKL